MLFDSSDIELANDPLITVGDRFELFFTYKNDTSDSLYSQLRETDDDYDYYNSKYRCTNNNTNNK